MESMTGYAFIEKKTRQFSFSVEIKSLNSKHLETLINLPKTLKAEENVIIGILGEFFSRGKIELNIDIFGWSEGRLVSLNKELIIKYYKELSEVQKTLKISTPVAFESVLLLEGVLNRERSGIFASAKDDIFFVIRETAQKALAMRKKEGQSIKRDVTKSVNTINSLLMQVKKLSAANVKQKQEQLLNRILSLAGNEIDQRIYTEIAILADRLDINEEIVRLKDHIQKFKLTMDEKNSQIGKKLDFLAQEMFREINTIGSKANNSTIAHIVVDMKNHIDKIREHCRNVV